MGHVVIAPATARDWMPRRTSPCKRAQLVLCFLLSRRQRNLLRLIFAEADKHPQKPILWIAETPAYSHIPLKCWATFQRLPKLYEHLRAVSRLSESQRFHQLISSCRLRHFIADLRLEPVTYKRKRCKKRLSRQSRMGFKNLIYGFTRTDFLEYQINGYPRASKNRLAHHDFWVSLDIFLPSNLIVQR